MVLVVQKPQTNGSKQKFKQVNFKFSIVLEKKSFKKGCIRTERPSEGVREAS